MSGNPSSTGFTNEIFSCYNESTDTIRQIAAHLVFRLSGRAFAAVIFRSEVFTMIAVQLYERCEKILRILTANAGYTTIPDIVEKTGVSRRSVYYDLCRINEWLAQYGIDELSVERGKGICLSPEKRKEIMDLLLEGPESRGYVFQPTERIKVIISYIIYSSEPVYAEELLDQLEVSRNTLFSDMRAVTNTLHEYDLSLKYEPKKGYTIEGDSVRIRALFFLYFHSLKTLYDNRILTFYDYDEIDGYFQKLKIIEKKLNTDYVDGNLSALAALIPIMYRSEEPVYIPGLKKDEIQSKREYVLINEQFPDLREEEKLYLALHLLGSRVTFVADEVFNEHPNQDVYEITKAIVTEFEKVACVEFENRAGLERALFVHISTSLYRYQYGIQVGNDISDDVKREYPNLFELTRVVAHYLEQMIGFPINDDEIAYLALHFGAFLKTDPPKTDHLRVLLVCVNGVSTGNMLRREISRLLPEAEIVDVRSIDNLVNAQNVCDVIISTIRISSVVPDIVVHPVLTEEDRELILNHQAVTGHLKGHLGNLLFEAVKKYVKPSDYDNLKHDIISCLTQRQGGRENAVSDIVRTPGLRDCLTPNRIHIYDGGGLWQRSIRDAGQCLVDAGSIDTKYLETIITQTAYYGPYMFLNENVMLAHAKPEAGVHHLDVSLAVFRKPVPFSRGRCASIIFILAPEDQESHLRILNDVLTLTQNEEYLHQIEAAETPEEISVLLYKILA